MAGLDIFMHEPALMELAQHDRDADCQAQKNRRVHGGDQQLHKGLAAGIIQHQLHLPTFTHHITRAHRPTAIQFVLQGKLVGKACQAGGKWLLGGGPGNQDTAVALRARA
ncbi:hypothetical protein D3C80_1124050 [compost metagenome]